MVRNSITVDVEEWFHVCYEGSSLGVHRIERVAANVDRLLKLFESAGIRSTFFMLGCVAEAIPSLTPRITQAGHEIASHGWSHTLVNRLTPEEFRKELRLTNDLIRAQTGYRPCGYRAPRWSLSRTSTPWAFDILREEGFCYDASCAPLVGVGDPHGRRVPYCIQTAAGPLWEIPPLVTPIGLVNLPTGGGWGFRFFPIWLIERTIQTLNKRGKPAVLFVHPRELDPYGPRVDMPKWRSFITYGSRRDAAPRLSLLFSKYCFVPVMELVDSCVLA